MEAVTKTLSEPTVVQTITTVKATHSSTVDKPSRFNIADVVASVKKNFVEQHLGYRYANSISFNRDV